MRKIKIFVLKNLLMSWRIRHSPEFFPSAMSLPNVFSNSQRISGQEIRQRRNAGKHRVHNQDPRCVTTHKALL